MPDLALEPACYGRLRLDSSGRPGSSFFRDRLRLDLHGRFSLASGHMKHHSLFIVASLLLAVAPPCLSREVQVLNWRFEIPDSWHSEGGGPNEGKFFATGSASRGKPVPPIILVEACAPSATENCDDAQLPDPPKDFEAEGCGASVKQVATLRGGIEEARWVCETVETMDGRLIAGISIYRHSGSFLYLAHFSAISPDEVSRFLDGISQSLAASSGDAMSR